VTETSELLVNASFPSSRLGMPNGKLQLSAIDTRPWHNPSPLTESASLEDAVHFGATPGEPPVLLGSSQK
jgi:hypothetical protein